MSGKVLITGGAGFIGSHGADISQARRFLGYEPRTHVEEGPAELARGLTGQIAIDRGDRAALELERRGLTL